VGDIDSLLAAMRDSGLTLEFTEFGARGALPNTRALALYRILQEALTNALRHGDGSATVELEWGATAVDLTVTNRPSGAALESAASPVAESHSGHGIDGMRERAALAGGELVIHSGDPFRVRARLPHSSADDTSSTVPSAPVATSTTTEVLS
jgi:signal transduction histidine kinase